ncbi:hypothetical protein [Sphingomicrobium aestuariivivum]|uniref:hypothetical protein n=1 Tax=Sphingomicrobium aestuariivivum TaxID=1582356 RepID=UPI001FD63AC7|nr:hypothetical protein [Sphingomicrobium aestuariivivum]MCJ8192039.1 hypothetical protein [Sphingomicrobium aestuariivivum]
MHRFLATLFWCALIAALLIASLPDPTTLTGNTNDKLLHVIAFALLSVLARLAFPSVSLWKLLTLLSAFGALIELVQAIPVLGRDSELADWIADTLAAALVFGIISLVERNRNVGRKRTEEGDSGSS